MVLEGVCEAFKGAAEHMCRALQETSECFGTLLGEEVLELLEVGGGDVGDGVELHACGVPGDPVKPLLGAVV